VTHKLATYSILAISALGLSALPAFATTCGANEAVTTGFTCSLGSLTFDFTNVQFIPSSGVPPPSVELNALTGINGNNYVLDFSVDVGGFTTPPSADDLDVDYSVTGGSFTQVDSSFLSDGSGTQSLLENVYTDSTKTTLLATLNNKSGAEKFSPIFGPVSSVYITKDFSGLTSEFQDSIISAPTPEPSSLGFMLMGVLGIGLVSRKFRRA
jgi:hypothetical protein